MISYLLYFFIMITFSTDPKADIDWKVCSSFSQIIQTHLKGFGSGIKGILMRQIQILIHIDRGIQIQIQPTKMMAMMMKMVIRWVQCLWWWNDDEMMTKWWWDDEYVDYDDEMMMAEIKSGKRLEGNRTGVLLYPDLFVSSHDTFW